MWGITQKPMRNSSLIITYSIAGWPHSFTLKVTSRALHICVDFYSDSITGSQEVLTFIPLQLVFGDSVCTAIKVLLQGVHLSAQDVPEGLHLRQLLTQAMTFLSGCKMEYPVFTGQAD